MRPSEETGVSPEDRRGAIIEFVASMVTNPDDVMPGHQGTRANKLKRDNMLVIGATAGPQGTKAEVFAQ
eukprot:9701557-Heterocapsa_arctica.AAC.1